MNQPWPDFRNRILGSRPLTDVLMVSGNDIITANRIATRSCFEDLASLDGANVMVTVTEALDCALTLIDLDGLAKRIVICPPNLPQTTTRALIEQAKIDVIIEDEHRPRRGPSSEGTKYLPFSLLSYDRKAAMETKRHDTEWVLLTSGTTGVPKMVSHSLESLVSNIKRPKDQVGSIIWATFNDTRRFSGLQMFLHSMLTNSMLITRKAGQSVAEFLPILAEGGATHVSGTPTHWRKVLMFSRRDEFKFEQITLVGEIVDQPLLDALHSAYPNARITHIYGSTETGTGFSVHDGMAGFPKTFIGKNFGGAEFAVEGEKLLVRSVRSAKSYVGIDLVLKNELGWIDTGDAVELVGERYRFLGRRSGTINVGGSHVHPEEVEGVLNSDPRVRLSHVSARRNPFTGSILVADVVVDEVSQQLQAAKTISAELIEKCRSTLADYKVPALIRIVDEINESASGKLERRSG